ncbi:MAG: 30S ribosomal protein S5 [Patescibacteria group bacterium]
MTDDIKPTAPVEPSSAPAPAPEAPVATGAPTAAAKGNGPQNARGGRFGFSRGPGGPGGRGRGGPGGRGGRPGGPRRDGDQQVESDYEEKNIEVARVTRVTKGGKRMRFRVLTVIGNRKGRVGFGLAKGVDVAAATAKATAKARKSLITVPLVYDTIPHPVMAKYAAAQVLLKPAPKGTGVKAGGAVRIVLELAGVPNVVSKILGSANKINNVKCAMMALKKLKLATKPGTEAAS